MDDFECEDCGEISAEDQLSITGPIKEVDEDGNHTKKWAYLCPHCFSHKLQVLIKIRVRV